MGLLSNDGAAILTSIFSRLYVSATLYKGGVTYNDDEEAVLDDTPYPCKAQVDSATEAMRAADGFAETDRRILILSTVATTVDTDCEILINEGPYAGTRFMIASVTRDPCGAVYDCRARRQP